MGDPLVKKAQVWYNETYVGKNDGLYQINESGKTGWQTIYALRRALQYELGIQSLSDNFGPTTSSKFDQIAHTLSATGNPKENIVKILQCAFWCKGYDMMDLGFFGTWTAHTTYSVSTFSKDCGLENSPEVLNSMKMKAILDMSAMTLVYGGDSLTRQIQQNLNNSYHQYFGILSCDGIYQRDTNKALIFALQAEMGMSTSQANGNFGPGTVSGCPVLSVNQGSKKNIKILQYALYLNDMGKISLDGVYDSATESAVIKFRKFMKISPEDSKVADMPVIKALLTSNGDINRKASGCDTSFQITTQNQVDIIKSEGYSVIGRYLTGTVGSGINERNKYLTTNELNLLSKNNIRVFPIYQDGGWSLNYFKDPKQGFRDAILAVKAARNLGFKNGSTIYFACDFDCMDHEIKEYLIPYFHEVKRGLEEYGAEYNMSAYGPRNLILQLQNYSMILAGFVSNMSTGFSGNIGFKMPKPWAFDQYTEYSKRGLDFDKVAVSGWDKGQIEYNLPSKENMEYSYKSAFLRMMAEAFPPLNLVPSLDFVIDNEYSIDTGLFTISFQLETGLTLDSGSLETIEIKNGKLDGTKLTSLLNKINQVKDLNMDLVEIKSTIELIGTETINGTFSVYGKIDENTGKMVLVMEVAHKYTYIDDSGKEISNYCTLRIKIIKNDPPNFTVPAPNVLSIVSVTIMLGIFLLAPGTMVAKEGISVIAAAILAIFVAEE